MNVALLILKILGSHGTRILGIAQGTVALVASTTGIIPDAHLKYWLLASAILTYWRGQATSNAYDKGAASQTPKDPK